MDFGNLLVIAVVILCALALNASIEAQSSKKKARPKKTSEGQDEAGAEFVYILSNRAYANAFFKIGLTTKTVNARKSQLYTTGVPQPFDTCMVIQTENCKELEKELHKRFANKRINPRREWFKLDHEDILAIHKEFRGDVVQYDEEAIKCALGHH